MYKVKHDNINLISKSYRNKIFNKIIILNQNIYHNPNLITKGNCCPYHDHNIKLRLF